MEPLENSYPIVFNKVTSPRYVTPTLRRARLLDWLHERASCRAVVLAADAGYGKTTLLWQWEREVDFPCYWYKLDRSDRDWSLHITYLVQAISQRHEGFGQKTTSILRQMGGPGTSRPGVAAYLVSEMHQYLTEPCTFIIDDWQYVASVTEVRGLWNQIIRDAPPTCRFVFASRAKPQLQFARFKTHGGYGELRTNALRFNDREIDELFRDIYRDPLEPSELAELERRTEGWAASLQLVEVALRERKTPEERRQFIESISADASDSDLFDFLAEEVLDQLAEETRNFLLSTSILMQITPELAERLTGVQDGPRELEGLEQRGLFTYRVDEKRYRYHNLFREFLEKRLSRERGEAEITGLHIHAASYYETSAEWPQAIHHYLKAGLQRQAARLIARHGEDVVAEGHLGMVDEWLQQLPPRTIRENARLSLLHGQALSMRGEYTQALEALNRARTYFARKGDHLMEATACVNLSSLYLQHGESTMAASIADDGLALAPEKAAAVRLRLRGNVAVTRTWVEDPMASARACLDLAHEAERLNLHHYAAIAQHNYGALVRDLGQKNESLEALERARSFWQEGIFSPFADNYEIALTLLSLGRVDEAEQQVRSGLRRTRPWPLPQAEAEFGLAHVLQARGEFSSAAALCERLAALPTSEGALRENAYAVLIDLLVLADARAEDIARAEAALTSVEKDPRYEAAAVTAAAVGHHFGASSCDGHCLVIARTMGVIAGRWPVAGALSSLKFSLLGIHHDRPNSFATAASALQAIDQIDIWQQAKWWARRLLPFAVDIGRIDGAMSFLIKAASKDPDGWRAILPLLLPIAKGKERGELLDTIIRMADKSTLIALAGARGSDVQEARRRLVRAQAPRLYVRTLGGLAIHRGGWDAPAQAVDKKRLRSLLGLLAINLEMGLPRDTVMDVLWPEADPAAAVNNLNQAVYKLRRFLDPVFRDGASPTYLLADSETVRLDRDLVRTDLAEVRRLGLRLYHATGQSDQRDAARSILRLARGEVLPELRYEEWMASKQMAIEEELRALLLPIATGKHSAADPLLATQAAAALVEMDPYDEVANLALATQLTVAGRRAAARAHLTRYAKLLDRELDDVPPANVMDLMRRPGDTSITT